MKQIEVVDVADEFFAPVEAVAVPAPEVEQVKRPLLTRQDWPALVIIVCGILLDLAGHLAG